MSISFMESQDKLRRPQQRLPPILHGIQSEAIHPEIIDHSNAELLQVFRGIRSDDKGAVISM